MTGEALLLHEQTLARRHIARRIEVVEREEVADQVAGLMRRQLRLLDAVLLHTHAHQWDVVPERGSQFGERPATRDRAEVRSGRTAQPVDRMAFHAPFRLEHSRARQRVVNGLERRLRADRRRRPQQ